MSEAQFAYSGFTLDELRSLASSPQVGTMQAMPQSFRALADHVGEVADLLTHAQADLPNWWKGPAADQAAATLGRAAAEAREFHDSATGAATAVSRCAQVVAEQQHQMMNVPEVPEPGVTDVVRRPATPFEALEAARQDASYQAAHEQAVQVVNGIAAQYIETRSQLASVKFFSGENFSIPAATSQLVAISPTRPAGSSLESSETARRSTVGVPSVRSSELSPEATEYDTLKTKHSFAAVGELTRHSSTTADNLAFMDTASVSKARPGLPVEAGSALRTDLFASPQAHDAVMPLPASPIGEDLAGDMKRTSNRRYGAPSSPAPETLQGEVTAQDTAHQKDALTDDSEASTTFGRPNTPDSNTDRRLGRSRDETHHPVPATETDHQEPSAIEAPDSSRFLPAQDFHAEDPNASNGAIIPPYSGIGSIRDERERRNPRPAYLKERKSAWLPDTSAAPPDGVITPDWFEQA